MTEKFYLFIFNDDSKYEMTCAVSFKDAIWEMAKYTGCGSDLFLKSLKGFDETDIEGLIALHNHFSHESIESVYEIKTKLWEGR